tara:strand:- start:116 stop:343 length:228 start_codon:yes stop_codon:yes gene_type:complete
MIGLFRFFVYILLILGLLSLLVGFILAVGFFLFGFELTYGITSGYDLPIAFGAGGVVSLFLGFLEWLRGRRNKWW